MPMILEPVPEPVLRALREHQHFFIIPHIDPDGDCIGSALALSTFLTRIGKSCHLHNMGPFTRKDIKDWAQLFKSRISAEDLAQAPNACAIIVDCSTIDRIGEIAQDINSLPVVVIDHHSSGIPFGDHRFINSTSPSTSLLIQQVIETLGFTVQADEAELIFFAFCTDTGFFRHLDYGSGKSLELVSRLIDAGASPKKTFAQLNSGAALIGRQHLGMLLSRTESLAQGKLLMTWETQAETEAVGKINRDSDTLYQMLLGVSGVEIVAVLREEGPQAITIGLRSIAQIDVGKVASNWGGGGHARAAGCLIEQPLDAVKALVKAELEKIIAKECK